MTRNQPSSPNEIVARIGIDLPPGTRIEHSEQLSGQDDAARVVAVLPKAAWPPLLRQLAKKAGEEPDFAADQNFHLGPPGQSWRPQDATDLRTAQLPWAKGAETLNVGLAPTSGGEIRLFIFWHQL